MPSAIAFVGLSSIIAMLLHFCAGGLWVSAAIALHRDFAGVLYGHWCWNSLFRNIESTGYSGSSIALACCLGRVNASAFHALHSLVFDGQVCRCTGISHAVVHLRPGILDFVQLHPETLSIIMSSGSNSTK